MTEAYTNSQLEIEDTVQPKRRIPYEASVVVFYQPKGRFIMIQERFKSKLDEDFALFGGTKEKNEIPEQTATREVKEELGLRRRLGLRYFSTYEIRPDPNSLDKTKIRVFTAPMRRYDPNLSGSEEGQPALIDGDAIQPEFDEKGNINWPINMINGFNQILFDVYWDLVHKGEIIHPKEYRRAA
jgi:8-oxo-dGTP pyrophosphatase MutT (NUDIX family)